MTLGRRLLEVGLASAHHHSASALFHLRSLALRCCQQECCDILARLLLAQPGECHARTRNEFFGTREPLLEARVAPNDVRALQGVRISFESANGAGLPVPYVGETRSGHMLARRGRMARGASLEHAGAACGVTGGPRTGGVDNKRRGYCNEIKRFHLPCLLVWSSISLRSLTTSGGQRLSMNASTARISGSESTPPNAGMSLSYPFGA